MLYGNFATSIQNDSKMNDNRLQRERDFAAACRLAGRRLFDSGSTLTTERIVRLALHTPAPQYYISYRRAETLLERYRHNRLDERTRPGTWLLMAELSERVDTLMARHKAPTLSTAICMVLHRGNASRFFMAESTAIRCWQRARRAAQNKKRTL